MSLIVEDGTGRSDAESYVSVAEASTILTNLGQGDAFDALDDQEIALRQATLYMEEQYRLRWLSFRVTATQALSWPRAYVPLPDAPYGYGAFTAFVPNNVVPAEVKKACALLAVRTANGELAPDLTQGVLSEKIGEIAVTYDKSSPQPTRYRSVDNLLGPFLSGSEVSFGLVRA